MNFDASQVPQWLWAFLMSPAGVIVAIGVLSVAGLKLLSRNKRDVEYAKAILISVHELMQGQLGDKAEAVYQAWLEGLESIADGEFTAAEMINSLTDFIKIALGKKNIKLNNEEQNVVQQAVDMTVKIMSVSSQSTQKAVTMMKANKD